MTRPPYRLTDRECQVVRETPELGWSADTTAEAWDRIAEPAPRRLPIDLPADTGHPPHLPADHAADGSGAAVAGLVAIVVTVVSVLILLSAV